MYYVCMFPYVSMEIISKNKALTKCVFMVVEFLKYEVLIWLGLGFCIDKYSTNYDVAIPGGLTLCDTRIIATITT